MNFGDLRRTLPTGFQSFDQLRSNRKVVYVDKTAYVYEIASNRFPQILTRPRRFGKSTLLSTVKELFLYGLEPHDGQTESYFKGLAIEQLWHDTDHYLVLHLDFYDLTYNCVSVEEFERKLMRSLKDFCLEHDLKVRDDAFDFGDLFLYVLKQLPLSSLVLLIDEYDWPIVYFASQPQQLESCRLLLRSVFGPVKTQSNKFRCVFFTGVTRFQDLELGSSAGNNFTELSFEKGFAACCGYTRDELKQYFAQQLRYATAVREKCAPEAVSDAQVEKLLNELSDWYDGYSFSGEPDLKVFSPWSVLRFFSNEDALVQPYWSNEVGNGIPQVLKIALDRLDLPQLINEAATGEIEIDSKEFQLSSLLNPKANSSSLLFQTGYLTLCEPFITSGKLHLRCPNKEIRLAFANLLARHFFNLEEDICSTESSSQAVLALISLDPEKIRAYFNQVLGAISYSNYPITNEAAVANFVSVLLFGAELKPRNEVLSSLGRADCVIDLPRYKLTIVFEYKFESSADPKKLEHKLEEAVAQVKKREYCDNAASEPRVARFALVFCADPNVRKFTHVSLVDTFTRAGFHCASAQ